MHYNTTIENTDALPIAYVILHGGPDDACPNSLYKGKPQFFNTSYITGTDDGYIKLVGNLGDKPVRLLVRATPALNIKFVNDYTPKGQRSPAT